MLAKPDKTLISASLSCFINLDGTLTGHYATQLISPFIFTCDISFDAQVHTDFDYDQGKLSYNRHMTLFCQDKNLEEKILALIYSANHTITKFIKRSTLIMMGCVQGRTPPPTHASFGSTERETLPSNEL